MKNQLITCRIRKNWHGGSKNISDINRLKIFPILMETYPDKRGRNKILQRRDFECRNVDEALRIANAVYGKEAEIIIFPGL